MIYYSMPTSVISTVSFGQITGSPSANPALVEAIKLDTILDTAGITPVTGTKTVGIGSDTPGILTLEKGIVTEIQESRP